MKSAIAFLIYILSILNAWAGQQTLVTLGDPAGDDYGNGELVYPQRSDFSTGDLDLLQLQVSRDDEGFWFEAGFRNPVRKPDNVAVGVGSETLADFARKGFYQFNLDIYVDTDRIAGSGNTFTLPGRHAAIAPDYAWERAVILTPRPEVMRQQLLGALEEQYPDRPQAGIEASVDQAIYFPTRIRVKGRSISFFVPASFFSGSDGTDWGMTAFVTGALTSIPADVTLFPSTKTPLERIDLGVMQPVSGHARDTFSYSGPPSGPIVDLLSPAADDQVRQLAVGSPLAGVVWGQHASGSKPGTTVTSLQTTAAMKEQVEPIGNLFQPVSVQAGVATPAGTQTQSSQPAKPSIEQRLQTLKQLYDQKLIDEDEYRQEKQRILKDL